MRDNAFPSATTNRMLKARFQNNAWDISLIGRLTAWVAVEGKVVLGARGKPSDGVLCGKSLQAGGKSRGSPLALQAKNVGSETSNVRGSHRSTRDGVLHL